MQSLPTPILTDIIRRVGHYGFRYLGPIIVAGKEGNVAVFEDEVLHEANMEELMRSPDMINEGSIYRPFLLRCINTGNNTACYIEGLRILAQTGPSREGIEKLVVAAPDNNYARAALGIFLICCTRYDQGMPVLRSFFRKVRSLMEAVRVAEVIVHQIQLMGTPGSKPYEGMIGIPEIPGCMLDCVNAFGLCFECFAFTYATRIAALC